MNTAHNIPKVVLKKFARREALAESKLEAINRAIADVVRDVYIAGHIWQLTIEYQEMMSCVTAFVGNTQQRELMVLLDANVYACVAHLLRDFTIEPDIKKKVPTGKLIIRRIAEW